MDNNKRHSRRSWFGLPDIPTSTFRPQSFYQLFQDDQFRVEMPEKAYLSPLGASSEETLYPHLSFQELSDIDLFGSQRTIVTDFPDFPPFYPQSEESLIRHDSISEEKDAVADDRPPDGGLRAWLVVIGGFLAYFATFGLLNTFGTFQSYYQRNLLPDMSGSVIAWIGSLQIFFLFIGGMVIGPLYDSYGARPLVIPGSLVYVLSLMFTSISTKYYQLMLAQGVMFGIGNAMLFYPTISSITQWFDSCRGLALGIAVSGSSLGGICWPLLIQYLLDHIGFGWATRITGFICVGLLTPACWLIASRPVTSHSQHSEPPPKLDFIGILKDWKYTIFSAGMFFVLWGMFIPFFYLPTYGQAHGMSESAANNLLAYLNAGSLVARVVTGFIADRFGRFNAMFGCALGCGILLFGLYGITSIAAIIAFAVLYGIFSGGLISLQSACIAQITPDHRIIGVKIGIMMAICSFGGLTGSPIGGALITANHGGFTGMIAFSAVILTAGGFLVLLARFIAAPKLRVF
ncbi:hypothetical protein DTO063F5_4553 [Paecilomyces variotii]|nr:hypothetical protein DTO063F5_4553 [Paecilomyces variotii]